MWSYSTSNPQRPQTREPIQEFHPRPPARLPDVQVEVCFNAPCVFSPRNEDQAAISKMSQKRVAGVRGCLHNPYAGNVSHLAKWAERVKWEIPQDKLICGHEDPRKHGRGDKNHD